MDSPKKVTFNLNNGEDDVNVSVAQGSTIAEGDIPDPTRTDYTFAGRYTSTDSGTTLSAIPFDFTGTTITGDITLYAKWDKDC